MIVITGHRFNPDKASKLINQKRFEILPPDEVLNHLELSKGETVADLGAGNGFFTLPIASKTEETVYAVDIETKMLELLKERAEIQGLNNIKYIESDLDQIKIPDQTVDKIIISFVIHEVPSIKKTLEEMKRVLNPNGKAIIIEWEAKQTEDGPPLHERIPSNELKSIVEENGYKASIVELNDVNYGLILELN